MTYSKESYPMMIKDPKQCHCKDSALGKGDIPCILSSLVLRESRLVSK